MRTALQAAQVLRKLHESTFGGKTRGRFKLSRDQFKEYVADRKSLDRNFTNAIADAALEEYGLVLIDFTNEFCVLEARKATAWRIPPFRMKFPQPDEE